VRKIIFLIFFNFLFADNLSLPVLFKQGAYEKICNNRWFYIRKYLHKREDLLSIVAYSCIKKGYIIPALDVAKALRRTPIGRKNAVYITTLFFMKKLILEFMLDGFNLQSIKLPEIKDNLLGRVFGYLNSPNTKYKREGHKIIIFDKDKKIIISLTHYYNLLIKVYINNKLIKKEIFW